MTNCMPDAAYHAGNERLFAAAVYVPETIVLLAMVNEKGSCAAGCRVTPRIRQAEYNRVIVSMQLHESVQIERRKRVVSEQKAPHSFLRY